MRPSPYVARTTQNPKYPWGSHFNRLTSVEEMSRFAKFIMHTLQVDTMHMDSTTIKLEFHNYFSPKPNKTITNYIRTIDSSIQLDNTDAIAEFLFKKFSEHCLDIEHFSWIQTANARVCNFVFAITNNYEYFFENDNSFNQKAISILSQPGLTNLIRNDLDISIKLSHMRFTNNAPKANNPAQKRDRIIEYFDRLDKGIATKSKTLQLIELFWKQLVKSPNAKSWLNFNALDDEYLLWVKDQIDQEELFYKVIDDNDDKNTTEIITTYFDLLFTFKKSDCIIKIEKIKKALTQKKYRKNNARNKQYNFVMDSDIDRKLKKITQQRGMKRNLLIEELIEKEYSNITSSVEHKNKIGN